MADRPILFSAPMVRALLDGRKTQTRRIAKIPAIMGNLVSVHPPEELIELEDGEFSRGIMHYASTGALSGPYRTGFAISDRLYVREEYYQFGSWHLVEGGLTKGGKPKWVFQGAGAMVTFDPPADFLSSRDKEFPGMPRWYKRLGRFMPRALSRMTLIVTDVRVERLNDISRADAIAEGLTLASDNIEQFWRWPPPFDQGLWLSPVAAYHHLWNAINDVSGWDENPWVVAVSFDVKKGNIDG